MDTFIEKKPNQALFNLHNIEFVTARVQTKNSAYLLYARRGVVLVICPDLHVLRGDKVNVLDDHLVITRGRRTILHTTRMQSVDVYEN